MLDLFLNGHVHAAVKLDLGRGPDGIQIGCDPGALEAGGPDLFSSESARIHVLGTPALDDRVDGLGRGGWGRQADSTYKELEEE